MSSDIRVRPLDARRALLAAGKLLSLGFPVLWLRSPTQAERWTPDGPRPVPPERRGKAPVAEGWASQDALPYETLADMWGDGSPGYNVGIRTGSVRGARVCVVVVDGDSPEALEWMKVNLPETQVKVVTRAGEHWYYRAPPGRVGNKVRFLLPDGTRIALDVKGDGGLVVGPSSVHGTGHVYRAPLPWTPERVDSMPVFDPGWFGGEAEWEGGEDPVLRDSGGDRRPPVYVDLSFRRKRAKAYLENCPGSVSGQGTASNDCLGFARGLVFGLCLPPEEAATLMFQSEWNARCSDSRGDPYPWTLDELIHKCRDAYCLAFGKPYGFLLLEDGSPAEAPPGNVSDDAEARAAEELGGLVREDADLERASVAWDFDPEERDVPDAGRRGFALTDTGNAERLVSRFGEGVRWVEDRQVWFAWDKVRWVVRPLALERASKRTARLILEEVPAAEERAASVKARSLEDPEDAPKKEDAEKAQKALDALKGWQKASESARGRRNMVQLAASEPSIAVNSDAFDRRPFLLNARNGVVDLRAGAAKTLRAHDRDLMMTKVAAVAYDGEAEAPTWRACLAAWCGNEPEMEAFLRRAAGYTLTGSVEEECFFLLVGRGQNGKSTFLNALAACLGPYAVAAPAGLLVETRTDKATPSQQAGLAAIQGARLVVASETDDSASLSEAQVKMITCRDRISAKRMYEGPYDFQPSHKTWLSTNHDMSISGTDDGIWRRIHKMDWAHQIPMSLRDNRLAEKLTAERPGILAWAVRGCWEWQERGLDPPPIVRDALRKYRASQDTMGAFLADKFDFDPEAMVPKTQVRACYEAWCEEHGHKPFGAKRFYQEMTGRGLIGDESVRTAEARMWKGLSFRKGGAG